MAEAGLVIFSNFFLDIWAGGTKICAQRKFLPTRRYRLNGAPEVYAPSSKNVPREKLSDECPSAKTVRRTGRSVELLREFHGTFCAERKFGTSAQISRKIWYPSPRYLGKNRFSQVKVFWYPPAQISRRPRPSVGA